MHGKDEKAGKREETPPTEEDLAAKEERILDIGAAGVAPVPGVLPVPADADETLDTLIERLPTQFRDEILKQYDLPQDKYSLFTIFKWATPLEVVMQIFGLIMAIGAGTHSSHLPCLHGSFFLLWVESGIVDMFVNYFV